MKRIVLALLFLLPVSVLSAAPLNKAQVSSTAKWLLHLDVNTFKDSSLGTLVLDEIRAEHQQQMEALAELLGSNPLRDIDNITLYGPDNNPANAVLMVSGRFDPKKLRALVALNETYKTIPYGSYTLHEWTSEDNGRNQVGVFARDNMILMSQALQPVEEALDVLDGTHANIAQSNNLACLSKAPANPIALIAAEDLGQLTGDNAHAAILKNSDVLMVIADEQNQNFSLSLDLWAREEQTALQIEQILLGIKAFMALNQAEHPELNQMLRSIQFSRQDSLISIHFQYPSADLFSFLKQHKELQEEIKEELQGNAEPAEKKS